MRDLSLCLLIAPLACGACIKSNATTHFLWLPCFCFSFASELYKHIFKRFSQRLKNEVSFFLCDKPEFCQAPDVGYEVKTNERQYTGW